LFNLISLLFADKNPKYVASAICLVDLCMGKQAVYCCNYFIRSGVADKLKKIAEENKAKHILIEVSTIFFILY
jgi:hypothetical protein